MNKLTNFLFRKNLNQLLIFSPFAKNHRRMLPQAMTQLKYAKIRHAVMDILMLNLVEKLMTHHLVHRPNGNGILGHLPDG